MLLQVAVRRDYNRIDRGAESYDAPPQQQHSASRRFRHPPGMRTNRSNTNTIVAPTIITESLPIIESISMDMDKDDEPIWNDTNSNDAQQVCVYVFIMLCYTFEQSAPPPPSPVDDIFANVFDASPIDEIGVKVVGRIRNK